MLKPENIQRNVRVKHYGKEGDDDDDISGAESEDVLLFLLEILIFLD